MFITIFFCHIKNGRVTTNITDFLKMRCLDKCCLSCGKSLQTLCDVVHSPLSNQIAKFFSSVTLLIAIYAIAALLSRVVGLSLKVLHS